MSPTAEKGRSQHMRSDLNRALKAEIERLAKKLIRTAINIAVRIISELKSSALRFIGLLLTLPYHVRHRRLTGEDGFLLGNMAQW